MSWVRGSEAAGQKQLMSSLVCLWLRLAGLDGFYVFDFEDSENVELYLCVSNSLWYTASIDNQR